MKQLKINSSITLRKGEALSRYLQEIDRIPLIDLDEEIELAQKIHVGDSKAFDRLVKANLRFVISVAKQYQGRGLSLLDLINEGNIGLIKAAQSFDETRGFKFISYAVWWIRQGILQGIEKHSRLVKVPKGQDSDVSAVSEHVSLDAPAYADDDRSLLDRIVDTDAPMADHNLEKESARKVVDTYLSKLGERERNIITASYGIGRPEMTLNEISEKYGLTRERVRQIRWTAIMRMRK